MSVFDLNDYFHAKEHTRRWRAESENASGRYELAMYQERMAELISQAEPVNSLGLDREKLRAVFRFVRHGRMDDLKAEAKAEFRGGPTEADVALREANEQRIKMISLCEQLKARVAELEAVDRGRVALQLDLKQKLFAAKAHVVELRKALEDLGSSLTKNPELSWALDIIQQALARTPAQSLEAVERRVLEEAAKRVEDLPHGEYFQHDEALARAIWGKYADDFKPSFRSPL